MTRLRVVRLAPGRGRVDTRAERGSSDRRVAGSGRFRAREAPDVGAALGQAATSFRRKTTTTACSGSRRHPAQRTGRASAMYLRSTGLDSGTGVPSASTGLVESSGVIAASSIRANPVLSGAFPDPSTRFDHPLMLSYQRRAPTPYGSAYQFPECSRDSTLWTLRLRKVRAMTISFCRASLPTACAPSP